MMSSNHSASSGTVCLSAARRTVSQPRTCAAAAATADYGHLHRRPDHWRGGERLDDRVHLYTSFTLNRFLQPLTSLLY